MQALRAVFAALAKHDPVIRTGSDEFEHAVVELTRTLERHRLRLAGEPVVRGRVRLTLPDDPGDPWLVELELVDDADPGRWCTADDVWNSAPRAVDLAGSESRLAALLDEVTSLADLVASRGARARRSREPSTNRRRSSSSSTRPTTSSTSHRRCSTASASS